MDIQQLSVKVKAAPESLAGFDMDSLIPVFHRWIREKRLPERLLIDVADYRHVPDGPGVLVVGHDCHFGVDEEGGHGLLYSRKRDPWGPVDPKLREAFRDCLTLAQALEADTPLRFLAGAVEVRVMSRLVANDEATFELFRKELDPFLKSVYGGVPFDCVRPERAGEPFGVDIAVSKAPSLGQVLGQIS